MDIDRYRKQYEAELDKDARRKPPPPGRAVTVGSADESKATAVDEERDLTERVASLVVTLLDRKQPVALRSAALNELSGLAFLGPRFAPFRADYKQALRTLAVDPRKRLRESALELLAMDKDPYARELLVRGLEQADQAIVSDARALQLLGYDDHGDLAPLARRVFRRATGSTREEALRMLATDPKSEKLFSRLLKDKQEMSNIRRISASGLQSLNPSAFERAARTIVADDSDYKEIRATSLAALAHGRETRDKAVDPKLMEVVTKLSNETRSPMLRASCKRFLRATKQ